MRNSQEIKKYAERMWKLEEKCQLGEDISESIEEMEQITNQLEIEEILEIAKYIEDHYSN